MEAPRLGRGFPVGLQQQTDIGVHLGVDEKGSKSADLVQILAVCTMVARSTDGGQRRMSISELSAWAAAVVPFRARLTVRSLLEMAVTSICS
jgi:hypothetical protein